MSHSKQSRIDDTKLAVFTRDQWRCCHVDGRGNRCPQSATECAHLIGQGHTDGVMNLWNQTYNERRNLTWIDANVMHNPLNLRSSCNHHNDYFNIGFKPETVKAKLEEIHQQLTGGSK